MLRNHFLVSLRTSREFTQRKVVELLNDYGVEITESYYGMIESGARKPSLVVAQAIAKLFERSVEEIFFANQNNKTLGCEAAIV